MNSFSLRFQLTWLFVLYLFAGLLSSDLVSKAVAQESMSIASLKLAPLDADVYSVSLRMQEQW
ncbi:MAG TPA: hypothetical protein VM260_14900, partial [Pirellula sp.]|nr:hypothetical protein [Pirellula sp.]